MLCAWAMKLALRFQTQETPRPGIAIGKRRMSKVKKKREKLPERPQSASSSWSKNAPETRKHVCHEPKNCVSLTMTWSHSSLSGEGTPPEKALKSQEGAQGQAEGEHAARGQLHVRCAFPLTCAEIGCCPYLSGSVSPKLMWSILLFRRTKGRESWSWSEIGSGSVRPTPRTKPNSLNTKKLSRTRAQHKKWWQSRQRIHVRISEIQIWKRSNSGKKMTHIIYCEPHMNQSSWASPAEVPVTDVLQDSSEGLQILDKTLSKLPGSSPGGLCGAPSSAGEISVQIFSNKYCFSKFSFSGQSFHQKQTPGSIPGDAQAECQAIRSFIHACLVSSSSKFLDRLCHIHACNLTVNSPSDLVILSSCKHLLKYQSIQFNKI